jgi:hypothetical protein
MIRLLVVEIINSAERKGKLGSTTQVVTAASKGEKVALGTLEQSIIINHSISPNSHRKNAIMLLREYRGYDGPNNKTELESCQTYHSYLTAIQISNRNPS